ncbi:protein ASPARTIC PROTEASE IN GUARD CELL 2 isoform X1 [Cryptomeria japonica]|uniref:protein ASPARTIC PROTEASE IN GUARD CELL 2 isoform X1 n=1 Tax=Cryptomeria japonica TaxID=3369 RepID=UPI0025AC9963|nr:protein ASPARTIC PROTEASE IN GUARD CELL 2 isoform X1 [Cryptomeria japonica]
MEPCRLPAALSISLLIFLFLVEVVSAEKKSAYHALDVVSRLREVSSPVQVYTTSGKEEKMVSPWSLQVFHRDGLVMGNVSYEQRLRERLERDSRRVKTLNRWVEKKLNGNEKERIEGKAKIDDVGGDVISGLSEGIGEYLIRIGVGTPATMEYLVLDTGSDVTWLQCKPCSHCYNQVDPVFDPSLSTSFTAIPCDSQLCNELDTSGCDKKGCLYGVSYGDGSFTVGHFVKETLTFGTAPVKSMPIGCGQDNEGLFQGAGGLLGLGGGPLSFPSQLGSSGTTFSYCLVDRYSDSKGTLRFGPGAVSSEKSVFTALLKNPQVNTFYYVSLTSITVGELLVALPKNVSGFDEMGKGGIIVDSGTTITRLQAQAYGPLRDAFLAGTTDLPRADGMSIFDTCYDLSGRQTVEVPTISFQFSNGASLALPASNYIIPVDSYGTFCLAFAPTSRDLSIIGNFQQQGIQVSFDSTKSLVGFADNQC